MKRIGLLVLMILFLASCSNEEIAITKHRQLNKDDEFNLLMHHINVDYQNVVLDWNQLKDKGVKKYTLHIEHYKKNKKVNKIELKNNVNHDVEFNDKEIEKINNFYNINDCSISTNKCRVDIYISSNNNGGVSIEKEMDINHHAGMIVNEQIDINENDFKLNEPLIVEYQLYFEDDSSQKDEEVMAEDSFDKSIKKIASVGDESIIVYFTFSDTLK